MQNEHVFQFSFADTSDECIWGTILSYSYSYATYVVIRRQTEVFSDLVPAPLGFFKWVRRNLPFPPPWN